MNSPTVATAQRVGQTAEDLGVVPNLHMWIGNGWLFCRGCQAYRYHHAYSHPGTSDCFEVCDVCHRYYGRAAETA
jgi:hypothetical protein